MTAFLTTESLSISNSELFTLQASAVAHERQGEAAEAAFMAKASNLGFAVAKPWDASATTSSSTPDTTSGEFR
jgi:hypothetical protein